MPARAKAETDLPFDPLELFLALQCPVESTHTCRARPGDSKRPVDLRFAVGRIGGPAREVLQTLPLVFCDARFALVSRGLRGVVVDICEGTVSERDTRASFARKAR